MNNELGPAIRDELLKFLGPLASAALAANGPAMLLQTIGHVGALGNDPQLLANMQRLSELVKGLTELEDQELASWQGVRHILSLARDLVGAVDAIESAITDPALAQRAQNLGVELAEHLFALYLRSHHPQLLHVAATLTLITPAELYRSRADGRRERRCKPNALVP